MSISGLLTTMNLPELLQWAKFGQKTGTIIFERRGIVKKVFVENGLIVSASSNDPKEYLGQVLICFGWIDEATLNDAFQQQAKTKKLLGRLLIENYQLKEKQVLQALRIKIEETIYDLFLWEEGKFIYQESIQQLTDHDRLETAITIDQVMFEGARRLDEWKEFKKAFPTDDVIFKKKSGVTELGDLEKDFITKKIFNRINGQHTMRHILLDTHAPEYRGIEAFAKLYWGHLIEAHKKGVAKTAKAQAPQTVLQEAMELFKAQKVESAYEVVDQYLQSHPDDDEAQTLYRMVRESYLILLKGTVPLDAIPVLNIDFSQLSEKVFSSKDGFMASRVNGQWDVKSLVMVSPLGELESLRILKKLTDEGVIRISN
jgi:hypothetical protein